MANIQLILIKNKKQYDISEFLVEARWSGKKGSAPRTLEFSLVTDNHFNHPKIDIENSTCHIIYKVNGEELFRGIILKQNDNASSKKSSYKAYDNAVYLSNNKDTLCYKNKTASYIFRSICKRYGLSYDKIDNTKYVIKELVQQKKTIWDCILEALSRTYKHTNKKYYVRSKKGKLSLIRRNNHTIKYIIETGVNIQDYSLIKSYEKVVTRVVIYNDKNKLVASAKDRNLERKIGIFQSVENYDDDKNKAQLKKLCESTLNKSKKIEHTLSITVNGNVNFVSGDCVQVIIKPLNIAKKYYIDSDTHTFNAQGSYTTSLSLNAFNENDWGDK